MIVLVGAFFLSLAFAAEALAQPAVVTGNVNLRQDPSTANPRIMLLIPGDELVLLEPEKTNGYFHVRTASGEEGWAFGNRVRVLEDEADDPEPATGPPEVFRGCGPEGNAQHAFRRALNRLKNRNTIPGQEDPRSPRCSHRATMRTGGARSRPPGSSATCST